ncbi:MAG TPA: alpha-1,4-glucan--maltose-1-phosphate maltosyltransferase [Methylomirabilota bacterium]|nr:alpha-1,4-glucan--maltose-1-phosphate maltosyltransferase [Methylomirabilota bacterium]
MEQTFPENGRRRVVIENVAPQVNAGYFAVKRTVGERVTVEADIFADGHDVLSAVVKYRKASPSPPRSGGEGRGEVAQLKSPHPDPLPVERGEENVMRSEAAMKPVENDRWRGEFVVTEIGNYFYTVEAWVDHFKSWRADLQKKLDAKQDVSVDLLVGAEWIEAAIKHANSLDAEKLLRWAKELREKNRTGVSPVSVSEADGRKDSTLAELMARYPDRSHATIYEKELCVSVDRERARFGAWYELFPRSFGGLRGCEEQLPRLTKMGFDILYLPPIHPVGKSFRKGKNNSVTCEPGEPGSPWAIGSSEGGHKAIHPELGTLDDFQRLIKRANEFKMEIALDIAFQCAPDHPYVREHPEWFWHRPDGTIQYAENPPKKYQDIVPFNFECDDWKNLWRELKSIFEFWIEQGVSIFRVDNPHTKTFGFWEWCIGELKAKHPGLIFLAEAFTRPKVMYRLAKLGFTQSYNYFPWRNTKDELESYFTELTQSDVAEFLRPNLWPNTPDILTQFLQTDGRAAFAIRFILAATLGASYGIYGPAFELCENVPREPGGEEYLNSEKYEIKLWDLNQPQSLENLIARVNQIRRANPALQSDHNLKFHRTDNPELIAYTKSTDDKSNTILVIVNLSPHYRHSGWLELSLEEFGLDAKKTYQMHDLLTDTRYLWNGKRNYVELNPQISPAHIFQLRRYVRTERDFDYFI